MPTIRNRRICPESSIHHYNQRMIEDRRDGVKYCPHRSNLVAPHLVPFDDESRSGWCVSDHIVEHTHIVAVSEDLLDVNALDDVRQPLGSFDIVVCLVEAVNRALESQIIVEQLPSCCEVSPAHRRLVLFDNFLRACHAHASLDITRELARLYELTLGLTISERPYFLANRSQGNQCEL